MFEKPEPEFNPRRMWFPDATRMVTDYITRDGRWDYGLMRELDRALHALATSTKTADPKACTGLNLPAGSTWAEVGPARREFRHMRLVLGAVQPARVQLDIEVHQARGRFDAGSDASSGAVTAARPVSLYVRA